MDPSQRRQLKPLDTTRDSHRSTIDKDESGKPALDGYESLSRAKPDSWDPERPSLSDPVYDNARGIMER